MTVNINCESQFDRTNSDYAMHMPPVSSSKRLVVSDKQPISNDHCDSSIAPLHCTTLVTNRHVHTVHTLYMNTVISSIVGRITRNQHNAANSATKHASQLMLSVTVASIGNIISA